jgi:hypothetical protein
MTDEEEQQYALATWLADKIFEVSEEADCDPAVLMQSCVWVIGYLLKHSVPPDMRKAVHEQLTKKLWSEMSDSAEPKPKVN